MERVAVLREMIRFVAKQTLTPASKAVKVVSIGPVVGVVETGAASVVVVSAGIELVDVAFSEFCLVSSAELSLLFVSAIVS